MTDDLKEKLTAAIKEATATPKRRIPLIAYGGIIGVVLILTLVACSAIYSSNKAEYIEASTPVPDETILADLDPELFEDPHTETHNEFHLGVGCSKRTLLE